MKFLGLAILNPLLSIQASPVWDPASNSASQSFFREAIDTQHKPFAYATFSNKAPLLVSLVDNMFITIAEQEPQIQDVYRSHLLTILKTPQTNIRQLLEECTNKKRIEDKEIVNKDLYYRKLKSLNLSLSKKNLNSKQKTNILKNWIQARLNSCSDQIGDRDLTAFILELAKTSGDDTISEIDTLLRLDIQEEIKSLVSEVIKEYETTLPEEYKESISKFLTTLQNEVEKSWETVWVKELSEQWENTFKHQFTKKLDDIKEEFRSFVDYIFDDEENLSVSDNDKERIDIVIEDDILIQTLDV